MPANKILYISYNPATLIRDEQLLMRAGYVVDSVFGIDGVMACRSVAEYSFVLIDDACPLDDRKKVINGLKEMCPGVKILPADWAQEYAACDSSAPSTAEALRGNEFPKKIVPGSSQGDRRGVSNGVDVNRYWKRGTQRSIHVEFRLLYQGRLPRFSQFDDRRRQQVHMIRKELHEQLKRLWRHHHALSHTVTPLGSSAQQESFRRIFEMQADNFNRCGYRFLPLVCRDRGIECCLEILLLTHDDSNGLKKSFGAFDSRLNPFVDALRMPRTCDELMVAPDTNEDPFYVLMEDDSLVNEVTIRTDRLLTPLISQGTSDDVVLIVHVKSTLTDPRDSYAEKGTQDEPKVTSRGMEITRLEGASRHGLDS